MDEPKPVPSQGAPNGAPKETQNETPKSDAPASPRAAPSVGPDPQTIASFERAAIEMAGRAASSRPSEPKPAQSSKPPTEVKPAASVAPAPRVEPTRPTRPMTAFKFVDQYDLAALPFAAAPMTTPMTSTPSSAPEPRSSAIRPMFDDTFRITFTTAQSIVVAIAIILIMLGAFGMAAYSSIIAYDWSCRAGWVEKYCPPVPELKPLPRPEFPV